MLTCLDKSDGELGAFVQPEMVVPKLLLVLAVMEHLGIEVPGSLPQPLIMTCLMALSAIVFRHVFAGAVVPRVGGGLRARGRIGSRFLGLTTRIFNVRLCFGS
jgi:hypothetical protein